MKKINLAIATILIAGAGLTVSSCGKYDEGPKVSLLTKKMRLTGQWDLKETDYSNGVVETDNSSNYVEFKKDGTATAYSGSIGLKGTWKFTSSKEKLQTSYTAGNITTTIEATIIRLTNKELWLKDSDNNIAKSERK